MKIKNATNEDFLTIREIANKSWPVAYGEILSEEQLNWMLSQFYSDDYLQKNIDQKHLFYLVFDNETAIGFFAIEHFYKNENITKLHKLYLNPEIQNRGFGKKIIDFIVKESVQNCCSCVSLNVNKYNKAVYFYKKMGFKIVLKEIIDIGNGYVMDDFGMEKKL
ncbi:MAG: Protease synthase and sporulation negative regulatory protein 1 [Bacteroidota bacterium]